MSEADLVTIHTDGAARGNPGPAAYAYIIRRPGDPPVEAAGSLGQTTNNVAEYTALVKALERAAELGVRRVAIHSDSELMVKQMKGEYRVKNPDLRKLYDQASQLRERFESVRFKHVPREENRDTDRLCNEVLDGSRRPPARLVEPREEPSLCHRVPASSSGRHEPAPKSASPREQAVHEEAVLCLQAAAQAWARGNPRDPDPADVWDQLWSILLETGLLRSTRR